MAHDGQDNPVASSATLPGLLSLTSDAIPAIEGFLDLATTRVRDLVTEDGKVSGALLEANQTAAHGLAWLATYVEALRQMQGWAERLEGEGRFGETEALIHQIAFGEYLWQIYGGLPITRASLFVPRTWA